MSKLLAQAIKGLQDEWPKFLLGLTVPAAQYLWRWWHERQSESRKQTLRTRIIGLAEFRQRLIVDVPDAGVVAKEADLEYSRAVEELATLSAPRTSADRPRASYGAFRRWFLLYTPRGLAWVPHTLYFVFLGIDILCLIGLLADDSDSELGDGLIGLGFLILLTLLFRSWAARSASQAERPEGAPGKSRAWIAIVTISLIAFLDIMFLLGISLDDNDEWSFAVLKANAVSAVIAVALLLAIAAGTWYWRRRVRQRRAMRSLAQSS